MFEHFHISLGRGYWRLSLSRAGKKERSLVLRIHLLRGCKEIAEIQFEGQNRLCKRGRRIC